MGQEFKNIQGGIGGVIIINNSPVKNSNINSQPPFTQKETESHSQIKQKFKEFLSKGRIEECFEKLNIFLRDSSNRRLLNDLVLAQGNFTIANNQYNASLIEFKDYEQIKAKTMANLIRIIDDIEE